MTKAGRPRRWLVLGDLMQWPYRGRPERVEPSGAVGHDIDEMPGIERVVCIKGPVGWHVRVFPSAVEGTHPSGGGLGPNIAGGLYRAIEDHNEGRP